MVREATKTKTARVSYARRAAPITPHSTSHLIAQFIHPVQLTIVFVLQTAAQAVTRSIRFLYKLLQSSFQHVNHPFRNLVPFPRHNAPLPHPNPLGVSRRGLPSCKLWPWRRSRRHFIALPTKRHSVCNSKTPSIIRWTP